MPPRDSAQQVVQQLAEFAGAAEIHAGQQHGIELLPENWRAVDLILDRERAAGDPADRESLALCYGAWMGQNLVARHHFEWVGLHEPVPPRIQRAGICFSPIDAVRRRLLDPSASAISTLIQDVSAVPQRDDRTSIEANRTAWDGRAQDFRFANMDVIEPMSPEQAAAALDPWLRKIPLSGRHVLCLAAGGGTHAPLFARLGAEVTVVDFSSALLAIDDQAARIHRLNLRTVQADMCDLAPLQDRQFDIVIHPVSASYLPDLQQMYAELARVMKPGGLYFSQQKSPASLQSGEWNSSANGYVLQTPAAAGELLPPVSAADNQPQREPDMLEYLHTLDALLGGLCRSGFIIENFAEPTRGDAWSPPGSAEHRACYTPPYLKILARRRDGTTT